MKIRTKNKIFVWSGLFLSILFVLAAINLVIKSVGFTWPFLNKNKSRETIEVCGKVYYPEYIDGEITVFWRKELSHGDPKPKNKPFFVHKVPGEYCISVLRNVSSFYVCAKCTPANSVIKNQSSAYFVSQLIAIGQQKNKINLDVHLVKRKRIMDQYNGPRVKISGRIYQENYINGLIGIAVETPGNHNKIYWPPDVNQTFLSMPGNYSIEVPANIGQIYINALNYPESNQLEVAGDKPGVIYSGYKDGPFNIGSSDIEGIDIVLR